MIFEPPFPTIALLCCVGVLFGCTRSTTTPDASRTESAASGDLIVSLNGAERMRPGTSLPVHLFLHTPGTHSARDVTNETTWRVEPASMGRVESNQLSVRTTGRAEVVAQYRGRESRSTISAVDSLPTARFPEITASGGLVVRDAHLEATPDGAVRFEMHTPDRVLRASGRRVATELPLVIYVRPTRENVFENAFGYDDRIPVSGRIGITSVHDGIASGTASFLLRGAPLSIDFTLPFANASALTTPPPPPAPEIASRRIEIDVRPDATDAHVAIRIEADASLPVRDARLAFAVGLARVASLEGARDLEAHGIVGGPSEHLPALADHRADDGFELVADPAGREPVASWVVQNDGSAADRGDAGAAIPFVIEFEYRVPMRAAGEGTILAIDPSMLDVMGRDTTRETYLRVTPAGRVRSVDGSWGPPVRAGDVVRYPLVRDIPRSRWMITFAPAGTPSR